MEVDLAETTDTDWSAQATLLRSRFEEFGITRHARTTALDVLGVPTASVVRPWTSDVIWVYSGKGLSDEEALVKAVMEAVERTSSLWPAGSDTLRLASASDLRDEVFLDPSTTTVPTRSEYSEHSPCFWVEGTRLEAGRRETAWVPAELVFGGRPPDYTGGHRIFLTAGSNGLGAGLTLEHAAAHALREVLERHIVSQCELAAGDADLTALAGIAKALNIETSSLANRFKQHNDIVSDIEPGSLPAECRSLLHRFTKAGLDVRLKLLSKGGGPVVVAGACQERLGFDSVMAAAGFALHEDPVRAVQGALLELAQTRATDLQGAREDRSEPEKSRKTDPLADHWLLAASATTKPLPALPARLWPLDQLLQSAADHGLMTAFLVALPTYVGLHVTRVVMPFAETWHSAAGRARAASDIGGVRR